VSLAQLRKRLVKVEMRVAPANDNSFTYEELCRSIWQDDPDVYKDLVKQGEIHGSFVPQFEREDAEAWRVANAAGASKRQR
jgi:hypothetical protein